MLSYPLHSRLPRLRCDITSIWIGERLSCIKEIKKAKFREQAEVFNSAEAAKDELVVAGEKALVSLYGGGDERLYRLYVTESFVR